MRSRWPHCSHRQALVSDAALFVFVSLVTGWVCRAAEDWQLGIRAPQAVFAVKLRMFVGRPRFVSMWWSGRLTRSDCIFRCISTVNVCTDVCFVTQHTQIHTNPQFASVWWPKMSSLLVCRSNCRAEFWIFGSEWKVKTNWGRMAMF